MGISIGMVELSSIAKGIEVADCMVKAAQVDLIKCSTICPGKYVVILSGDVADVNAAIKAGEALAGHTLVDRLIIANVHPQLIPAIAMTNSIEHSGAVGVLEYYSVASAIKAADEAAKVANVTLIEVRIGYAVGGKGFVTLTGSVDDVHAAVKAGIEASELLVESVVLPRPDPKVFESLL